MGRITVRVTYSRRNAVGGIVSVVVCECVQRQLHFRSTEIEEETFALHNLINTALCYDICI